MVSRVASAASTAEAELDRSAILSLFNNSGSTPRPSVACHLQFDVCYEKADEDSLVIDEFMLHWTVE